MSLHWESSYAIVLALMDVYPNVDVEAVGLDQLYQMIIALPNFVDEPELVDDGVLEDILGEWYEEVNQ